MRRSIASLRTSLLSPRLPSSSLFVNSAECRQRFREYGIMRCPVWKIRNFARASGCSPLMGLKGNGRCGAEPADIRCVPERPDCSPSWKGTLRLSLVSCPVFLVPATTRAKSIRLHQVWVPQNEPEETAEFETEEPRRHRPARENEGRT